MKAGQGLTNRFGGNEPSRGLGIFAALGHGYDTNKCVQIDCPCLANAPEGAPVASHAAAQEHPEEAPQLTERGEVKLSRPQARPQHQINFLHLIVAVQVRS